MNKYPITLLLLLLIIPGVSAHGDSHSTNTNNSDNTLSLELILLITTVVGIAFLALLTRIIGLNDKRLILIMVLTSFLFLGMDYYYLKYYYFA